MNSFPYANGGPRPPSLHARPILLFIGARAPVRAVMALIGSRRTVTGGDGTFQLGRREHAHATTPRKAADRGSRPARMFSYE